MSGATKPVLRINIELGAAGRGPMLPPPAPVKRKRKRYSSPTRPPVFPTGGGAVDPGFRVKTLG